MDLERNLPGTLVKQLTNVSEREVFDTWRVTKGAAYSQTLATTAVRFEEQRAVYTPSGGQRAMNLAINSYLKRYPFQLNPESCTWDDVIDEMNKAKQQYQSKGPLRTLMRHGNGMQRNLQPLLECIPTDDGLGVLKAGLTVIFNAVKRRSDACEKIFGCLESIPHSVANAYKIWSTHRHEPTIIQKIEALHHALFEAIPALIDILLRQDSKANGDEETNLSKAKNKLTRVYKDVFWNPVSQVESLVAPIDSALSELKACAEVLDRKNIQDISRGVDAIKTEGHYTRAGVSEIQVTLTQQGQQLEELTQSIRLMNEFYRMLSEGIRIKNLKNAGDAHGLTVLVAPPGASPKMLQSSTSEYTEDPPTDRHELRLLVLKESESDKLPIEDMERLTRAGSGFSEKAKGRASYLFQMPQFQRWLRRDGTDAILVEGHCSGDAKGRVSPLSIFCSVLAMSLLRAHSFPVGDEPFVAGAAVLFFACSLHSRPGEQFASPRGMLRSMISQLLQQALPWGRGRRESPKLSFLREKDHLVHDLSAADSDLCNGDGSDPRGSGRHTRTLLYVFIQLVRQISSGITLYIIMDDVTSFESEVHGWRDDLEHIVNALLGLCRDERNGRGGPPIKLLMTSPGRFIALDRLIRPDLASEPEWVSLRAQNMGSPLRPIGSLMQLGGSTRGRVQPRLRGRGHFLGDEDVNY